MDNKTSIKNIFYAAVTIGALVFFASWLSTDAGFKNFSDYIKDVPFANFIFKTGCGALNIKVTEPDFEVSTVAVSLSKMIVSTAFKALIFSLLMIPLGLLTGLLNTVNIAMPIIGTNFTSAGIKILEKALASRTKWIDDAEKILDSWWYKRVENIITLLAATAAEIVVDKFLFKKYQNFLDSIGDQATLFISVILCLVLFWLYSYIFSAKNNMGTLSGLIKTLFFQIIPELFSLFCVNVFYFLVYAIADCGVKANLLISLIVLLVLIALWEEIKKKLLAWCVGHLGNDQRKVTDYMPLSKFIGSFFTVLPAMLSFYLILFTMFQIGNPDYYQKLIFLKFPLLDAMLSGLSVNDLFTTGFGNNVTILIVKLFMAILIAVWLLRSKIASNVFLWAFLWCSVVMTIDLCICFALDVALSSSYEMIAACILGVLVICLFLYKPVYILLTATLEVAVFIIYNIAWHFGWIALLNENWLVEITYLPVLCLSFGLLLLGGFVKKLA